MYINTLATGPTTLQELLIGRSNITNHLKSDVQNGEILWNLPIMIL